MKPQPRETHSKTTEHKEEKNIEKHHNATALANHIQTIEGEEHTAKITGRKTITQTHAPTLWKTTPDTATQKAVGSVTL